jgi:hypothetical protein
MIHFFAWLGIGMAMGTVIGSIFEGTLRRLLLRKALPRQTENWHRVRVKNRETNTWWTGPVCVSVGLLPFVVTAFFVQRWGIFCGATVACTLHYWAYEYGHECAHLAEANPEACWRKFRCLNAQRALHHQCVQKNSNAVVPLSESLPEKPRLRLEFDFSDPRPSAVPNGKQSRKKFNHARQLSAERRTISELTSQ